MLNSSWHNLSYSRSVALWKHRGDRRDNAIFGVYFLGWIGVSGDASNESVENVLGQVAAFGPIKIHCLKILDRNPFLLVVQYKAIKSVGL
jgi:hypothetical protein